MAVVKTPEGREIKLRKPLDVTKMDKRRRFPVGSTLYQGGQTFTYFKKVERNYVRNC